MVVIAVIAILLALLMPALRQAKETARILVCASHVRQSTVGLTAYETENGGHYPYFRSLYPTHIAMKYAKPGLDFDLRPTLKEWTGGPEVWYCPSNPLSPDAKFTWNNPAWGGPAWVAAVWYYLLAGYEPAYAGVYWPRPPFRTNASIFEESELVLPSDTPMITEWGGLDNGIWKGNHGYPEGRNPTGTNTAFFDGHVAWRPFGEWERYIQHYSNTRIYY